MRVNLPKPAAEVKNLSGDTLGTVDTYFQDSDGDIREVFVQLFASKAEPDPRIVTVEEYGAIMWNAGIDKETAMDVLYALREAGVHPMKKEVKQ